ncbi:Leucine Rich Repeat [Seminavis robusta]|uniref:Leucine Rich Repeat n=1 Tax=Seminavis robusta TaxID=568900 RepID=A0A9N8ERP6_9STRA|nr:Leucine Rich Repeat [Seminavis robusta]|eukprot:Sro1468_g275210.1 Leucine Rich Repeat (734) ;mRNA; f:13983-16264
MEVAVANEKEAKQDVDVDVVQELLSRLDTISNDEEERDTGIHVPIPSEKVGDRGKTTLKKDLLQMCSEGIAVERDILYGSMEGTNEKSEVAGHQLDPGFQPASPLTRLMESEISSSNNGIMGLPQLDRTPRPQPESLPGAHRMYPLGSNNREEESIDTDSWESSPSAAPQISEVEQHIHDAELPNDVLNGLLVAANPVEEKSTDFRPSMNLVRPDNYDAEAANRRKQQTKQVKTNILLGILLAGITAIVVTVLAVLLPRKVEEASEEPMSMAPSVSPSQAPSSFQDYLLSLLPETTINIILGNVESPQSMAFQWLQEDTVVNVNLTDQRIQQRFAMSTLFFATGGELWQSNDNWLNHSVHECEWYMKPDLALQDTLKWVYPGYLKDFFPPSEPPPTKCNDVGAVQHLWLDQNNLVGSVPAELYMLTSLKTLSIGFDRLVGTISTHVGALTALEGLAFNLIYNAGVIPTEIGLLTNLRGLGLTGNNHQGIVPSELWQLTNLQDLIVSRNPELNGSIPTEIGTLSNLRWLNFDDCNLSGTIATEIGQLESLEWLLLHENRLSGSFPTEVGKLSALLILSLFDNALEGTLPTELGLLSSSSLLNLRGNQFAGGLPSEVGLLTNLTISLVLRNNTFTGLIPSELGLLTNLREISLEHNNFSGHIPSQLGLLQQTLDGIAPLHTLNLQGNALLLGTVPPAICNITGECIPNSLDPCEAPFGLLFDCTEILCGCDCSCV